MLATGAAAGAAGAALAAGALREGLAATALGAELDLIVADAWVSLLDLRDALRVAVVPLAALLLTGCAVLEGSVAVEGSVRAEPSTAAELSVPMGDAQSPVVLHFPDAES
jgi:hypothetical protein